MRLDKGELQLSATDLAKHLACRHLTNLDFLATQGKIERSHWHDPAVAVLEERGFRHEAAYLAHLHDRGYEIVRIENELELGDRR